MDKQTLSALVKLANAALVDIVAQKLSPRDLYLWLGSGGSYEMLKDRIPNLEKVLVGELDKDLKKIRNGGDK